MTKTYLAPAFANPVVSLESLLDEAAWDGVPAMRGFRVKATTSYFMHGEAWAKAAHDDDYLYMIGDYDHFDDAPFEYLPSYDLWCKDNGVEFFLLADGTRHQFEANPVGAKVHLKNGVNEAVHDMPFETAGTYGPGRWRVAMRVPLAVLGSRSDMKINIRINMEYGFSGYFEPSYMLGCEPVDELKLTGTMTAAECQAAEAAYNQEYVDFLASTDTFPECELYRMAQLRSKVDMSGILDAYAAYKKAHGQERIEKFIELKRQLTNFEVWIFKAEHTSDKAMTVVPGPLTVDFSKPHGTLNTGLYGVNGAPKINDIGGKFDDAFQKLRISSSRLHDIPWNNCNSRLVDVSMIFANPKLDPSNPDYYYFEQTDDYLANVKSYGAEIVYRLGCSIEHSKKKYFVKAPADYGKFAEICVGIVRHYNRGWADGPAINVKYWEVWNEANIGACMWDKEFEDYCRMYTVVAKRLKAEFPEIKVGGPASGALKPDAILPFLRWCIAENAPLDFMSWHRYGKTPWQFAEEAFIARRCLDAFGFETTELHLNEWHYAPGSWTGLSHDVRRWMEESPEGMMGSNAAAFNVDTLIRWQDSPLDISNFYMVCSGLFGFRYSYGGLNKNYYSYLAFAQLRDCVNLVQTTTDNPDTSVLIAGHDGAGKACIIISAFKHPGTEVRVNLKNAAQFGEFKAYVVDQERNMDVVTDMQVTQTADGTEFSLPKKAGSAVFVLKNF